MSAKRKRPASEAAPTPEAPAVRPEGSAWLLDHRSCGLAVYLYLLLSLHITQRTEEEVWWLVASGNAISDEELGWRLDVAAATARRWRQKLEQCELLRSELVRARHRKFWIKNFSREEKQPPAGELASPSELVH